MLLDSAFLPCREQFGSRFHSSQYSCRCNYVLNVSACMCLNSAEEDHPVINNLDLKGMMLFAFVCVNEATQQPSMGKCY